MTAITRRSRICAISPAFTLATEDDLDGTTDNTQAFDVTGALRVLIIQNTAGTAGTAGIDVVEISKDGGKTWAADTTLLAMDANDATGTIVADAALNAAGVEPTDATCWKSGPHEGPTAIRIGRKTTTTTGTTWVTGAPAVYGIAIGLGPAAPSALA